MLSFSRVSRIYLSMNLACSELYMMLKEIFRRCDLYGGTNKQNAATLALYDTVR